MDAVAESGREERNPRVSTTFGLGVENERADAGRDDQTYATRANSQALREQGEK